MTEEVVDDEKLDFPFDSIDELIDQVTNAIQHWHDIHTDEDAWIEDWIEIGNLVDQFEQMGPDKVIQSDAYHVDWGEKAYRALAEAYHDEAFVRRCPECETWFLEGDDYFNECPECEIETERPNSYELDELAEYLEDAGFTPGPEHVEEGLRLCWPDVSAGFRALVGGVIDECESALDSLNSSDNAERLAGLMMAIHIMHYSGNIVEDYGGFSSLEYVVIDAISEGGLIVCFTQEEIDEWLEE